ncbi:hypothetical protein MASR1M46_12690 [Bacteroidales bacterium]
MTPKLISPRNLNLTGAGLVEFTDIDMNNHTNNARYELSWIQSTIPSPSDGFISEFAVNFNHRK